MVRCRHRRATDEHRDHALVERQRATQLDADIVVGIVQAPIAIRSDDREPLRTDDREHDVTPLQSTVDAQCEVLAGVDRDDILVDVVLVEPSRQPVAKPACPGRSIASSVTDEYAHRRSALSLVDTTPSSSRSGKTPRVTRPLPSVLRGPSASCSPFTDPTAPDTSTAPPPTARGAIAVQATLLVSGSLRVRQVHRDVSRPRSRTAPLPVR